WLGGGARRGGQRVRLVQYRQGPVLLAGPPPGQGSPAPGPGVLQRKFGRPVRVGRGREPLRRLRVAVEPVQQLRGLLVHLAAGRQVVVPVQVHHEPVELREREVGGAEIAVGPRQQVPAPVGGVLGAQPVQRGQRLL